MDVFQAIKNWSFHLKMTLCGPGPDYEKTAYSASGSEKELAQLFAVAAGRLGDALVALFRDAKDDRVLVDAVTKDGCIHDALASILVFWNRKRRMTECVKVFVDIDQLMEGDHENDKEAARMVAKTIGVRLADPERERRLAYLEASTTEILNCLYGQLNYAIQSNMATRDVEQLRSTIRAIKEGLDKA